MSEPGGGLADRVLAALFRRSGIVKGSGTHAVLESVVRPLCDAMEARTIANGEAFIAQLATAEKYQVALPWPAGTVPFDPAVWHTGLQPGRPTGSDYS